MLRDRPPTTKFPWLLPVAFGGVLLLPLLRFISCPIPSHPAAEDGSCQRYPCNLRT